MDIFYKQSKVFPAIERLDKKERSIVPLPLSIEIEIFEHFLKHPVHHHFAFGIVRSSESGIEANLMIIPQKHVSAKYVYG